MDPGGTVDTGKEIIDALSKLFPGKEVEGIFLTHAHTDHTGGIPPILETFSSTVYAGKTTACFLGSTGNRIHLFRIKTRKGNGCQGIRHG